MIEEQPIECDVSEGRVKMDWYSEVMEMLVLATFLVLFLMLLVVSCRFFDREIFHYDETGFDESLMREERELEDLYDDTAEWTNKEVDKVYGQSEDPSGKVFIQYSNLFTNVASLDATKLDELRAKQAKLQPNRPFRAAAIKELLKKIGKDMTFHTNAIEENRLSAHETEMIMAGCCVGRARELRDIFAIVGHQKAFSEVLQLAHNKSDLTVDHLKNLHKMVSFESGNGGILRSGREIAMISGVKTLFAPPWEVENLIKEFLGRLSRNMTENVHPFLLAVSCHGVFGRIRPFRDGNSRMARLLMNYVLLRAGYPALIVHKSRRWQYRDAIKMWNKGDPGPLTSFMLEMLERSFDLYFRTLGIEDKHE